MLLGRIIVVCVSTFCILWPLPALADKRIALVIGNGDYKESPLRNPVNDAKAMATTLKRLGFEVTLVTNATLPRMQQAILSFGEALRGDGAGLFYYAGHGLQVKGQNYLVPVDADIASEAAVRVTSVPVDLVTEQMGDAGNALNVVILDACRNNPFERRLRGGLRGLAAMDAARGTLIAYATAPGSVAADGDGDNGLYTGELLKALGEPNLKAEEVFKRVRANVVQRTGGKQTPWESSSLTGDFVFNLTVNVKPPAESGGFDERQFELAYWNSIKDSASPVPFRAYLDRYPKGNFAEIARFKIDELEAKPKIGLAAPATPPPATQPAPSVPGQLPTVSQPPSSMSPAHTETGSWSYVVRSAVTLRDGPSSGARRTGQLKADDIVEATVRHDDGKWVKVAKKDLVGWAPASALSEVEPAEAKAWDKVKNEKRAGPLRDFLKAYPKSHFTAKAKAMIDRLAKPADALTPSQTASPHTTAPGQYGNATVTREDGMYSAPDVSSKQLVRLQVGVSLRVIGTAGDGWCSVTIRGRQGREINGFMRVLSLSVCPQAPEPPPQAVRPAAFGNARIMRQAKILAQPSYLSSEMASLSEGTRIHITGEAIKGWYPVQFIGRDGHEMQGFADRMAVVRDNVR